MKTLAVILLSASCAWSCQKDYIDGPAGPCTAYMPRPEGATIEESAKWVSDEKPPKNPQPEWETGKVKDVSLQNTDVARRSPPDSCKGEKQIWTGANCLQGQEPGTGKRP